MSKLLFGTDPEAFATYEKNGEIYALPPYFFRHYLHVPASEDPKHPVFLEKKGSYKAHEDGAAFEMAIRPSFNPKDLWDTIQACSDDVSLNILSKFPEHCMPKLSFMPTVKFEVKRWENEAPDFFMSTQFGCDPDRDAFDTERRAEIIDASTWGYRYGGGHIHFSGDDHIQSDPILCVKTLALTAGIAAIAYSDVPDLEHDRTYLYGRPGKFRVQTYGNKNPFGKEYAHGIEYRTISGRWASDWNLAEKIFNWAKIAFESLIPSDKIGKLLQELSPTVTETILSADQNEARNILAYLETQI